MSTGELGKETYRHIIEDFFRAFGTGDFSNVEFSSDIQFLSPLSDTTMEGPREALIDESMTSDDLGKRAETVSVTEPMDGIEFDAHGNLYLTAVEEDAIKVRRPDGHFEFFARATNFTWPDNIAVSHDGYLIFTASQVHLMPAHNGGVDMRSPPYNIFRRTLTSETRSTSSSQDDSQRWLTQKEMVPI